jgi:Jacalin-like lectin domain
MRDRFTLVGVGLAAAFLLGVVEMLTPSVACGQEGGRTKIGTSGANTGTEFVDKDLPKGAKVIGVKIRSGDWIDAVELLYKTADGKVESLGKHGGDGGGEDTFMLEEGEHITGITGKSGLYVMSLTIITNKRKSQTYGLGQGEVEYHYEVPQHDEIIGFFGRAADYVDQIGIWVRKRP